MYKNIEVWLLSVLVSDSPYFRVRSPVGLGQYIPLVWVGSLLGFFDLESLIEVWALSLRKGLCVKSGEFVIELILLFTLKLTVYEVGKDTFLVSLDNQCRL